MKTTKITRIYSVFLAYFVLIVLLLNITPLAAQNFEVTDNSNDVIKVHYVNGLPEIISENVNEGSVDIVKLTLTIATTANSNSTITVTFSGTPVVDNYHFYLVWLNFTAPINSTHYLWVYTWLEAGMNDPLGAQVGFLWYLYNQSQVAINNSNFGLPIFGGDSFMVEYSIQQNQLIFSFNYNNSDFYSFLSQSTSISFDSEDTYVFALKSDIPNTLYNETTTTATLWFDAAPDEKNLFTGGDQSSSSQTSAPETSTSEETNETEEQGNLPIELPSSGFEGIIGLTTLTLIAVPTILLHRKKKSQ